MPEILRTAVLGEQRTLGSPRPVLDPVTQRVVDEAVATAEARARAEGEAAGRAAASAALRDAADRVAAAVAELRAEVAAQRTTMVAASLELAEAAAGAVLGASPGPDARALLDRIREATDLLDDDRLELRVGEQDASALTGADLDPRVTLVADPRLAAGDVEVVGPWGRADLRREALVAAAVAVLADASVDGAPAEVQP
ncbi:hypothetical protein FTX61_18280 [Nitriliruptoraceae bacterium ZYF776]|nr:hypothetical protein [Profundirhabdus halotolerans]